MQKISNEDEEKIAPISNHLEQTTNSNTNQTTDNDFQISLNDFLEFLKLSCHVNDMISRTSLKPQDNKFMHISDGTTSARTCTHDSEIDLVKLAKHSLVNSLLGYKCKSDDSGGDELHNKLATVESKKSLTTKPETTNSTATITSSGTKHLHPKLSEKLDFVVQEGIMDTVLSFVCPVPIPSSLTPAGRAKAKQQQKQQQQQQQQQQESVKPLITVVPSTIALAAMAEPKETIVAATPVIAAVKDVTSATSIKEKLPLDIVTDAVPSTANDPNNVVHTTLKEQTIKATPASAATRRKSLLLMKDKNVTPCSEKKEAEVIIHVCDEVKNTSRDFSCPQQLLISKMGYFADVTAGQRLDEMDISVHCDVQIFDWLMKWIKHSANSLELPQSASTTAPQLDGNNVVPILVSASFLQMEPLLLECLTYCHARLSEVVRTSTNLSCLNETIIMRLAAMFTNLELEMVRDKKERITPRLWTKLIQSLCEPEPEALRGHFYSMSGLFRCSRCFNCTTHTMKSYVSCVPSNMRLNRWGQLISNHVRDGNWDINAYIMQLFKELKSWRKVYWKLWGHCHYLYCCTCEVHFPVYQMNWCRYHPDSPNFLGPVMEGRIAGPAGRYSCCGQQAFRFETMPGPNGCQYREHSVLVETDRERTILAIIQLVSENYALIEPPPLRLQEKAAAGDIDPIWQGISLTPQRCRQGLLPQIYPESTKLKLGQRFVGSNVKLYFGSSSDTESSSSSEADGRGNSMRRAANIRNGMRSLHIRRNEDDTSDSNNSSDGCESEHTRHITVKKKKFAKSKYKRQTEIPGRFWSGELSARSNQDHQRDFEEKIMKQVIAYVNKKTGSDQNVPQNVKPLGGIYVRLEAEWRESLKHRHVSGATAITAGNGNTTNAIAGSQINGGFAAAGCTYLPKQRHK